MPGLPADIRISLKKCGGPTYGVELVRQPVLSPSVGSPSRAAKLKPRLIPGPCIQGYNGRTEIFTHPW